VKILVANTLERTVALLAVLCSTIIEDPPESHRTWKGRDPTGRHLQYKVGRKERSGAMLQLEKTTDIATMPTNIKMVTVARNDSLVKSSKLQRKREMKKQQFVWQRIAHCFGKDSILHRA
jgi:hypothetical protein